MPPRLGQTPVSTWMKLSRHSDAIAPACICPASRQRIYRLRAREPFCNFPGMQSLPGMKLVAMILDRPHSTWMNLSTWRDAASSLLLFGFQAELAACVWIPGARFSTTRRRRLHTNISIHISRTMNIRCKSCLLFRCYSNP